MARIALIKNGVVDNVIEAGADYADPEGRQAVVTDAAVSKGHLYAKGAFSLPPDSPVTAAQLIAYAKKKQIKLRDGGITINVGTASAPLLVDVDTDDRGTSLVNSKVQYIGLEAQAGRPAPTFEWLQSDGSYVTLSADEMKAIGLSVPAWHEATYAALRPVLADVASLKITTESGIDSAGWPSRSR